MIRHDGLAPKPEALGGPGTSQTCQDVLIRVVYKRPSEKE